MKKKALIFGSLAVLLVVLVSVWIYGYHNRKSNDNLPALAVIAQMEEADVNRVLPGYNIEQLREVWGEPVQSSANEDVWQAEDGTILVVNYNNLGEVVVCGLEYEQEQ